MMLPCAIVAVCVIAAVKEGAAESVYDAVCSPQAAAGYSRILPPRPAEGDPAEVNLTLSVQQVTGVDDQTQVMSINFGVTIAWIDSRVTNKDCEGRVDWKDFTKNFWTPNLYFYHTSSVRQIGSFAQYPFDMHQRPGGRFSAFFTVSSDMFCELEYDRYPFDANECRLTIGSATDPASALVINTAKKNIVENFQNVLQYDVDFEDFGDDERTMKVGDVDFSVGGIKIILHRRYTKYIGNMFFPTTCMVLSAMVSFFIDMDIVPGRMGLLITTFLTLINASSSARLTSPKTRGATAMDYWLNGCLIFIIGAVLEYAFLLMMKTDLTRKLAAGKDSSSSPETTRSAASEMAAFKVRAAAIDRVFCFAYLALWTAFVAAYAIGVAATY